MKKLIIGAGLRILPGYLTHDIQDLPNIDICCDFWDLPKYIDAGSLEEIQITHVLEHFPLADTIAALHLMWGLLDEAGKIYIEVPNFKWHAEMILKDPTDRQIVEYAYGGQLNKWDFHYNGFTPEILKEDLEEVGFKVISLEPNSSIECWATK